MSITPSESASQVNNPLLATGDTSLYAGGALGGFDERPDYTTRVSAFLHNTSSNTSYRACLSLLAVMC
jgi:hypothetical protein